MGFELIFAGLIFMLNPCINIVDVFPDFIGCIFIVVGLNKLSDIQDRFFNARQVAMRLIPIYLIKFFLSVYIPVRWKSGLLPITFVYCVGEIVLMLLLLGAIYGGIEYMANLHEGEKHLSSASEVSKITLIFMLAKNILAFVPELFALESTPELDFSYNRKPIQTLSMAKPYVIAFFTVLILIFAIYCLYKNANFFREISNDTKFVGNLKEVYSVRVTENKKLMTRRMFKKYFVLLIIASAFVLDIIIDAFNFTPDILVFVFLIASILGFADKKDYKIMLPLLYASAIFSLFSTCLRYIFEAGINFRMDYESYTSFKVQMVDNGQAVILGGIVSIIEAILLVLSFYHVLKIGQRKIYSITEKTLPIYQIIVSTCFVGLSSVAVYILPLLKAAAYNVYINDTLVYKRYLQISKFFELATGYANIFVTISCVVTICYIIKLYRKADYLI